MWQSDVPPRVGMPVDILFTSEGAPEKVSAVSESQVAQEQVEKALSGAIRQGGAFRSSLSQRFSIGTILAEGLLLLAFFFLRFLLVENPVGFGRAALTGWQATGFNPNSATGFEYGILSLVAALCAFAPLAVAFLKRPWAHWLNAAPLAGICVTALVLYNQLSSAGRAAGAEIGSVFGPGAAKQMSRDFSAHMHIGIGGWLAAACAIYLSTRAFRKQPATN
jgi:hypothetical protein